MSSKWTAKTAPFRSHRPKLDTETWSEECRFSCPSRGEVVERVDTVDFLGTRIDH